MELLKLEELISTVDRTGAKAEAAGHTVMDAVLQFIAAQAGGGVSMAAGPVGGVLGQQLAKWLMQWAQKPAGAAPPKNQPWHDEFVRMANAKPIQRAHGVPKPP